MNADAGIAVDRALPGGFTLDGDGLRRGPAHPDRASSRLLAPATLVLGDAATYLAGHALVIRIDPGIDAAGLHRALAVAAVSTILLYWLAALYPGYRLHPHERLRRRLAAAAKVGIVAALSAGLVFGAWRAAALIVAFTAIPLALQPIVAAAVRRLLRHVGCWGETVEIIGSPDLRPVLEAYFTENWHLGANPVAETAGLRGIAGPRRGRVAFVATATLPDQGELAALRKSHDEIVLLADIPDALLSGLRPADVNGAVGLVLRDGAPHGLDPLRRLFDLAVALPAAICFAPLMLAAGAAIWLVDPGQVIYRQAREGLGGRTVNVLKLRTMYRDAEVRLETVLAADPSARAEWSMHFKLKHDPRILPVVGKILRSSSCDELPQLFNVIAGEMSIVGPRPFPDYHLSAMSADFRRKRASVTPGLTGLWQISARSDADIERQQKLDNFYIDNRSFWFDISLLFSTFSAVLKRGGAY